MHKKHYFSALVMIVFLCFALGSSDDRTPEQKAEDNCKDKTMAFVMSQSFVKGKLKAPSTAEFPYSSADGVSVAYLGECTHLVNAYVDSQNSFGAMIRTKYVVKLRYNKQTEVYHLEDISIQ